MDSPPLGPKPKSALPSHLINGSSPLHVSSDVKERNNLYSSIQSSNSKRQPIDLNSEDQVPSKLTAIQLRRQVPHQDGDIPRNAENRSRSHLTEAARDPRDEAVPPTPPTTSRSASPYTRNPPIDFDGLSWPSESS